ncbi:MAG TPA: biopolymer transporter ExbD [Bacteroidia bacterium]|nr:biopolymer transporter ExbD [Bacteroidia bacterium]
MARKKRSTPEINAGSMADIAFLLLIFFLVTTTMDTDTGLRANLPPMPLPDQPIPDIKKRNVLEIRVNSQNLMLVEGEIMDVAQLKDFTIRFITNYGKDLNLSENPEKAVVSLKNDRGTAYDTYVQIQDQLRQAYTEVRNSASQRQFGRDYNDLTDAQKKIISKDYPQRISEAEPEEVGGN